MKSLILFLFNFLLLKESKSSFIEPNVNSSYFVDNTYQISWTPNPTNLNISHIFLTHGDPFVLSKFSDNKLVLSSQIQTDETNFLWSLPFNLNYYNLSNIDWRILLSNTSTPYSGNIGTHSNNNLIILSDYFRIKSNMNISVLNQPIIRDYNYNFNTAGFTDNFNIKFVLFNLTHNITLIDEIIEQNTTQISNQNIQINKLSEDFHPPYGNTPQSFMFKIRDNEFTQNLFSFSNLSIYATEYNIVRHTQTIPIKNLYINASSNIYDNTVFVNTYCSNLGSNCNYNLHILNNGLETIIENITTTNYIVSKQSGNNLIYASFLDKETGVVINSNKVSFTYVPLTTSIIDTTITTITQYNVNNCSNFNDECDESYTRTIIFLTLGIICLILAIYYYFAIFKKKNKVYPKNKKNTYLPKDLEMGNRAMNNEQYENNTIETAIDDEREQDIQINNYVYPDNTTQNSFYPDLNDLENEPRSGALINEIYSRGFKPNLHIEQNANANSHNSQSEYTNYFDNYGYKRQIRRRHSSGSYNTIYGNGIVPVLPIIPKRNSSVDRYNHLERTNSFIPTSPTNDNTINIYNTISHPEDQNLDIAHITSRRITKRNNNNLRT